MIELLIHLIKIGGAASVFGALLSPMVLVIIVDSYRRMKRMKRMN